MTYRVPAEVSAQARQALAWRKQGRRGGTSVGWHTATVLANQSSVPLAKVRHIARYFPRHEVDKKASGFHSGEPGFPSPGRVAWALWGGDAGKRWAEAIVKKAGKGRGRYT